ncbi:MAG: type I-E CRISPR-associated protein Cse2/CasB [Bacillota bacterium]|jgi:CRISPR system Cascade subunit CasB
MQSQHLGSVIATIAGVIGSDRFSTGERAALRRMTSRQPPPLAFYRFALSHLPTGWDSSKDSQKDWITLLAAIAIMSPNAHDPKCNLGRVLAETNYSEARLERLLSDSAAGDVRRILVLRAARFLAAKSSPFNWVQAARLLLTQDNEKLMAVREQIAKDYYQIKRETE